MTKPPMNLFNWENSLLEILLTINNQGINIKRKKRISRIGLIALLSGFSLLLPLFFPITRYSILYPFLFLSYLIITLILFTYLLQKADNKKFTAKNIPLEKGKLLNFQKKAREEFQEIVNTEFETILIQIQYLTGNKKEDIQRLDRLIDDLEKKMKANIYHSPFITNQVAFLILFITLSAALLEKTFSFFQLSPLSSLALLSIFICLVGIPLSLYFPFYQISKLVEEVKNNKWRKYQLLHTHLNIIRLKKTLNSYE